MGRNELTCEQATELIGAYLDDELPTETRRRLDAHFLRCPSCAYEAQSLRITSERLRGDAGEIIASDSFRARTLRTLYADNRHVASDAEPITATPEQFRLPMGI
ncbi:MAG: zf-HC2 domain-containing protein [Fibrella sp.]|nr:zf-HC2 domain-containing protein [Armatimonadota bacterium]